jgi:predicted ATPase/DNA-binding SARP family transcriptional activator/Tfp pilus assembly protein PilF
MALLAIALLGTPRITLDHEPVAIERRKALALLAYLAINPGPQSRDTLATLLYPESDQTTARTSLRRILATLTAIARDWLIADSDTLTLTVDEQLQFDVARFRTYLNAWRSHNHPETTICPACRTALRAAVELYRGDFMAGFSLTDSPQFDEWQQFQAETLRSELATALEKLSRSTSDQRHLDEALDYARHWVTLDALNEPAHRRLMQIYAQTGKQAAALRQYLTLVELLDTELGATPSAETTALYEQIRSGERSGQGSRWGGAPATVSAGPSGQLLPSAPTRFLGRETELAQIAQQIADPACRLLTLVGPGGIGKTRLALQAASQLQRDFPDGVYHVSLVAVDTVERLISEINSIIGLSGQGHSDQLARLFDALRHQHTLLVLDNVDDLALAAPLLASFLTATRAPKVLVTSRERLNIQGEWVLDIQGLTVPSSEHDPQAEQYSAVQLFLQSARRARSDLVLTADDLVAIVQICQLVEGMPLAIELAAAWVRVLSPAEIAYELEQNLALLTTEMRDVPERHRSISAVFAQSWERLSSDERRVLRCLAVFVDGFQRAAAAEVANASPATLAALADKSLIRRDSSGRYAMHELLRQFVAARLAEDPSEEYETHCRHSRYYLTLLDRSDDFMLGPYQRSTLNQLAAEFDNLDAAWEWAIQQALWSEINQAIDGLHRFCDLRGWFQDGMAMLQLLRTALNPNSATPLEQLLYARATVRYGALLCWQGPFDEAHYWLHEGLNLLQQHNQELDVAFSELWLGMVAYQQSEYAEAQHWVQAGLAIYERLGNRHGMAWSRDMLGDLAGEQGDYPTARQMLIESVNEFSALGDQASTAWSLNNLGRVLVLMNEQPEARQLFEESLELFRTLSDLHGSSMVLLNLGELALNAGDFATAEGHFREALDMARQVHTAPPALDALTGLAAVAAQAGEQNRALELVALVLEQPAAWKETIDWAERLYEQLTTQMPSVQASRIEARGRAQQWEEIQV